MANSENLPCYNVNGMINWTTKDYDTITVHNGGPHADDVAACAIFGMFRKILEKSYNIIRTRDPAKFKGVVVDVGEMKYDHHGSRYELDADGIPYSGCSRLWEDVGTFVAGSEELAKRFKKEVLDPISKIDNGINLEPTEKHLLNWVPAFVPGYESLRDMDSCFNCAVVTAEAILYNKLKALEEQLEAEKAMEMIIQLYGSGDIAIIKTGQDHLLYMLTQHRPKLAVVEAEEDGEEVFYIVTIPSDENNPFSAKMLLPEEWGSLRDEAFAEVCGYKSAIFCHKGRFIAGFKNFDDACDAAFKAIAIVEGK